MKGQRAHIRVNLLDTTVPRHVVSETRHQLYRNEAPILGI